jgi:hypothetical protein
MALLMSKARYLLYHAELQRRTIQGIPTENKCLLFPYSFNVKKRYKSFIRQ